MRKRLLSFDPVTMMKTYHSYDDDEKKTYISYEQDVQPIIDYNKALQNAPQSEYRRKRDVWHIAHIPAAIVMQWRCEEGIDVYNDEHTDRVMKKLNDPSWKYLRSITGTM